MRIIIHDNVKKHLTDDEYKYLLLLEFHEEFVKQVQLIRQKLGIPVDTDGSLKELPDERKLAKMTLLLLKRLEIPLTLQSSIIDLVKWGKIFTATHKVQILGISHQLNRKALYNKQLPPIPPRTQESIAGINLKDHWYKSNQEILSGSSIHPALPIIQINKPLSLPELKEAISGIEKELKEAIEQLEQANPYHTYLQDIPIEELEVSMEIYRYRRKGIPSKNIYTLIKEQYKAYGNEDREIDRKYSNLRKILIDLKFIQKV